MNFKKLRIKRSMEEFKIAAKQSIDILPAEQKRILQERLNKIDSGHATFSSWTDVQKKYSNHGRNPF